MLTMLTACSTWGLLLQLLVSTAAAGLPGDLHGGLELLILHTNDMHARYEQTSRHSGICDDEAAAQGECYGGYARVSTHIKKAREEAVSGRGPPVLVLNAGDTFQGSIYYNAFKWRMAANFTNLLGFDAISLGNHEFDDGVEGLVPFLKEVRAPVLAANLDLSDVPALQPLVRASTVITIGTTRVGIIGYLTPDTAILSPYTPVKYVDEIPVIASEATRLKKEGVNIIIALGHSGYPMDMQIAEQVPDVDLVIGGHSHSFLNTGAQPDVEVAVGPYPTFIRQRSGREVPVVQAGALTKYLGRLKIQFDAEGEIRSQQDVQGSPILLDKTTPEDPQVLRELDSWRKKLDVSEPLAKSLAFLDGSCRERECNMGNMMADAFVHLRAVSHQGPGWTDAPIGIHNGGNIRTSIELKKNGSITLRDIIEASPFSNYLVVAKLSGDVLLQMLEHSVKDYDITGQMKNGGFLQFSGLFVTYDVSAAPGQRVVSARARCGDCDVPSYAAVDRHHVYTVVTNDFITRGGDGYAMLKGEPSIKLGELTVNAGVAAYLRDRRLVYPEVEGRINFVNGAAAGNSVSSLHGPVRSSASLIIPIILSIMCMTRQRSCL